MKHLVSTSMNVAVILLLAHCARSATEEKSHFEIGVLVNNYTLPKPVAADAFFGSSYALRAGIERGLRSEVASRNNVSVSWIMKDTRCDSKKALDAVVTFIKDLHVDAIFGRQCAEDTLHIALLASQWNVPMLAYPSVAPVLSDKTVYNTIARAHGTSAQTAAAVLGLCEHFKWRRVAVVHPDIDRFGDVFTWPTVISVITSLKSRNISVVEMSHPVLPTAAQWRRFISRLKSRARIVLTFYFVNSRVLLRELLVEADRAGLMDSGQYVFTSFTTEVSQPKLSLFGANRRTKVGATNKLVARAAATNVLLYTFSFDYQDWYLTDIGRIKEDIKKDGHQDMIKNTMTATLYGAALLYVETVAAMLDRGLNPRDGDLFINTLDTLSLNLPSGTNTFSNGDVLYNWAFGRIVGEDWERVATFFGGNKSWEGSFPNETWRTGHPPSDTPPCGFFGELCEKTVEEPDNNTTLLAVVIIIGAGLLLALLTLLYRRRMYEVSLTDSSKWKIDFKDIEFGRGPQMVTNSLLSLPAADNGSRKDARTEDATPAESVVESDKASTDSDKKGYYGGQTVYIEKLMLSAITDTKSRKFLVEIKRIRDLHHDNVSQFLGVCLQPPCLVFVCNVKGTLEDIIYNDDVKLDNFFKISFLNDIAQGLHFIHKSEVKLHGNLKTATCLVDSRWTVKLFGFGCQELRKSTYTTANILNSQSVYWMAPENVKKLKIYDDSPPEQVQHLEFSPESDVYSYAVVAFEILTRTYPYCDDDFTPKEYILRVKLKERMRPKIAEPLASDPMSKLMTRCWRTYPEDRPLMPSIIRYLVKINNGKPIQIADNMVNMLEKYSMNLEELVASRTQALMEEKKRSDKLLYSMLPRSIAESLKAGQVAEPESFSEVTIYFSDLVGFTEISSRSTPLQIVTLLNDLYTLFDDIISEYNVYKVETIGDAYMVVSGLPDRCGQLHAGEICTMALHLLREVRENFKIRHEEGTPLLLRIGIHSGPCVAGVVGLTMPRYCLFGDTVNTASRMESTGEAQKIHISDSCRNILRVLENQDLMYVVEERGLVSVKGKGTMTTYWLLDKHNLQPEPTTVQQAIKKAQTQKSAKGTPDKKNSGPPSKEQNKGSNESKGVNQSKGSK